MPQQTQRICIPESDGKPIAETDLHIDAIYRMRQMLKAYFAENPDVYVSGNIMMYYVKGSPQQSVSPDILVSFGIGKKQRRTYKVWEEGKPPDFVLEFSSKSTYQNDLDDKMKLYAKIGITEYFLYDAERCYLPSSLMAFRLVDGEYVEIPQRPDGEFSSETLCLTFHLLDDSFGIHDPDTEKWLQSAEERAEREPKRLKEPKKQRQKLHDSKRNLNVYKVRLHGQRNCILLHNLLDMPIPRRFYQFDVSRR